MQTLSAAPVSLLDIVVKQGGLNEIAALTPGQKSDLFAKLGVVQQLLAAGHGAKGAIVTASAKRMSVSPAAINLWLKLFNSHGFRGLIDGRRAAAKGRAMLPDITRNWICDLILRAQRSDGVLEVHRQVMDQWRLWKRTGDPQWQIPGFTKCPPDAGKGFPAGFSYETFRKCQPTAYQSKLAHQGTVAAYRTLPSIMSTRVGSRYLETIFFDDQKYDVQIRVPGFDRPMVPLGFNALERLTTFPFSPHIRLRWFDTEEKIHRSLTQKEFVWYVIQILCTEGYRTDDVGTTLVQEHGTAKAWSNQELKTPDGYHSFEQAINSLTAGCVRMDDSGLFNKPAFAELLYGPSSSGNPRFKAPIESFFHVVRNYMLPMIGQTGRNVDEAPEENYGIDQYERRMLKAAKDLPESIRDGIISNYLTGVEFCHMAGLAYDALANRTDHALEGWAECNFVEPVWRWEHDEPGVWHNRAKLANLPRHLREVALHEQSQNKLLTNCLPWSPAVARASFLRDPAIAKLAFTDAIHLLPTSWAKPVTVRDRHEIHITEELLPGETLIFLPELTTPRGRTEYLQPGDELMVYLNPLMPDTLLVCDRNFAFLGTLTRNVRCGKNNNQLEEMYTQRARLQGHMEAPVKRAMQPVADRRAAVADLNRDLIKQARDVTPPAAAHAIKQARPSRAPYVDPLATALPAAGEVDSLEADPFI